MFYLSGILFSSFFFAPSITVLTALVLGWLPPPPHSFPAFFLLPISSFLTVVLLGFADPAASAFGITFGKRKFIGSKTLWGLFGFVLFSLLVLSTCHLLVFDAGTNISARVLGGYFVVSLLGGFAELFSG